jgi:hypothetical protein
MLIQRVSLHTAAEVEAIDIRQSVMQQNQIRLKPETFPQSRFPVLRRKNFVVLTL